MNMEIILSQPDGKKASANLFVENKSRIALASFASALLASLLLITSTNAGAMGIAPQATNTSTSSVDEVNSSDDADLTGNSQYVQGNVTYDLTHVYDANSRTQIISCLQLGYQAMKAGGKNIKKEITGLQGNGSAKVIRFYSNEQEQSPGSMPSGAPATAAWTGPNGPDDMTSPPSRRTNIRIYVNPNQPYWYLVNTVWHELLHTTLSITHSQTTPEGSMPAKYVNDGIWYPTIKGIMLDFPVHAKNPITGAIETLYDVNDSPWS